MIQFLTLTGAGLALWLVGGLTEFCAGLLGAVVGALIARRRKS